jgi:dynein assembly factor 1, axonemal
MPVELTKQALRQICKENKLYMTPSINDKLYLHYKGFATIENLDEYTGLKALWLEGNGFSKIQGLESQKLLKSLYLHENLIETIEGLEAQESLDNLNLSKNCIKKIENLSHMKELTTLIISHNQLTTADDVRHVLDIPTLQTLDLQQNRINDTAIVDMLAEMPDLRVIYLMGNPVVKEIPHYRKTMISKCKALRYLDDRPVFDEERRRVSAWAAAFATGGLDAANEAERNELRVIKKEKDDADERNFRAFEEIMRQGKASRRQQGLEVESDDENGHSESKYTETPAIASEVNEFTNEPIIDVPESAVLREAREERWGSESLTFGSKLNQLKQATSEPAVDTKAWTKLAIEEESDCHDDENDSFANASENNQEKKIESKFMSLLSSAQSEVAASVVQITSTSSAQSGSSATDLFSLD